MDGSSRLGTANGGPASEKVKLALINAEAENRKLRETIDKLQLEMDSAKLNVLTANSRLRETV